MLCPLTTLFPLIFPRKNTVKASSALIYFGEFHNFVTYVVGTSGNINILKGSHCEDNTLFIPTRITRPPYLQTPTQSQLT